MAKLTAFLVMMSMTLTVQALEQSITVIGNVQIVKLTGEIVNGDGIRFQQLVATSFRTDLNSIILLNSGGGSIPAAYSILGTILELQNTFWKNGKQIVSFVDQGAMCASACVPIYMTSRERYAHEAAVFGFHSPTRNGIPDDGLRAQYLTLFYAAGVKKEWITQNEWKFLPRAVTWEKPIGLWGADSGMLYSSKNVYRKSLTEFINGFSNNFAVPAQSQKNKICILKSGTAGALFSRKFDLTAKKDLGWVAEGAQLEVLNDRFPLKVNSELTLDGVWFRVLSNPTFDQLGPTRHPSQANNGDQLFAFKNGAGTLTCE